ncbi:hypothetical protein [Rhodovulum sp. P5]|nr:hypothetical protein [Rhodovulum sp. P5]
MQDGGDAEIKARVTVARGLTIWLSASMRYDCDRILDFGAAEAS